ncbi:MAG: flavodoxin-dependent (E)-4-hydroxy-3-methylbut-2-enyl-diphosphate synthase [Spirochaetales bacterium]|nr:flavodoxin-dependent (E)-4-hydroxy-3-methylbut-2-enyl-diphosphate synthase [Spirochaetales bacterium]
MFSSKSVDVNGLQIGGDAPVRVQTMYDSAIAGADIDAILHRMRVLKSMGCELIRFSYVSSDDRENFTRICHEGAMPAVADIHFDYRMALEALECGAPKIRINPGTIGAKWKTEEVVRAAKERGAAIRIGLNSGSLPKNEKNLSKADLMVDTALEYADWFESWGFSDTVISLKASDPDITLEANRKLKKSCDYPIHLGVTEAGGIVTSCVRSAWALGSLLKEGIGDTIRVSITGSIETEVQAAIEILRTVGLRKGGVRIVSCPRCGRHSFDSQGFLERVEKRLLSVNRNLSVAIMGCQVNGPGEAKGADLAVTGIGKKAFLYVRGELSKEVDIDSAEAALFEEIDRF